MGNLWLKIKVWTKITLFLLLVIYVLIFITENNSQKVEFWFFPTKPAAETSVFLLTLYAFLAGVIGFVLVRTTFATIRQVRDLQHKTRTERLEREMAEMRTKAALLRPKPLPGDTPDTRAAETASEE